MPDITQVNYTHKDLIALMLKDQGIHAGNWILSAQLGFSAMNVGEQADGSDASPAGVVAIKGIRIERVPEPLPFSVNAGEVNPEK